MTSSPERAAVREESFEIPIDDATLDGDLALPATPQGIVLFAHGSGSSRRSPRNRAVAAALQDAGLATLLFDLLTPAEADEDARTGALRFDVLLLAARLEAATLRVARHASTKQLPIGYFGASTGAAAALVSASRLPELVRTVVSRGGRPDLAGEALAAVRVPTLLIVGGHDEEVLELNERAKRELAGESTLSVVPGATHLFEEPGTLDVVTDLAREWFVRHLRASATGAAAGS